MSRAGRPSKRPLDALIEGASEVFYGCVRAEGLELRGASVQPCELCGAEVLFTPSVLAEKRGIATSLGRTLIVACGECILAKEEPLIAAMPSAIDVAEARRLGFGS